MIAGHACLLHQLMHAVCWPQDVKAEALGPRHSTSGLHTIAAEPWLSTVHRDASKGADAGWFWRFKVNSIKVWHPARQQDASSMSTAGRRHICLFCAVGLKLSSLPEYVVA